ncbi:MAG TPA: hypothetical protein VLH15_03110, partial [Dehalococcoidales bacterium]|nr:hypothetical protein [Dehalococcoidales bacterium]
RGFQDDRKGALDSQARGLIAPPPDPSASPFEASRMTMKKRPDPSASPIEASRMTTKKGLRLPGCAPA